MSTILTTTIHPLKWQTYVSLALSALVIFAARKSGTTLLYFIGGFTAVIAILLWWFLHQTKLTLDDDSITMKTKASDLEFLWKDVTNVFISHNFNGKRKISYFNFEAAAGSRLSFATSQYAAVDLKKVAEAAVAKCGHASIDAAVAQMAL